MDSDKWIEGFTEISALEKSYVEFFESLTMICDYFSKSFTEHIVKATSEINFHLSKLVYGIREICSGEEK